MAAPRFPLCNAQKSEKVDDFYAARSETIRPLRWSNFVPSFVCAGHPGRSAQSPG